MCVNQWLDRLQLNSSSRHKLQFCDSVNTSNQLTGHPLMFVNLGLMIYMGLNKRSPGAGSPTVPQSYSPSVGCSVPEGASCFSCLMQCCPGNLF